MILQHIYSGTQNQNRPSFVEDITTNILVSFFSGNTESKTKGRWQSVSLCHINGSKTCAFDRFIWNFSIPCRL